MRSSTRASTRCGSRASDAVSASGPSPSAVADATVPKICVVLRKAYGLLEAERRGYEVWHYTPPDLVFRDRKVLALSLDPAMRGWMNEGNAGVPWDKAMAIMRDNRGSHFDPAVIAVFRELAHELHEQLAGCGEQALREQLTDCVRRHFAI